MLEGEARLDLNSFSPHITGEGTESLTCCLGLQERLGLSLRLCQGTKSLQIYIPSSLGLLFQIGITKMTLFKASRKRGSRDLAQKFSFYNDDGDGGLLSIEVDTC